VVGADLDRETLRLAALTALILGTACKPLPPPPVLPTHAGPDASPEGTTTVMLVVGMAGAILGGGGVGVAGRVEYQATDDTTLGVELTGGVGGKLLRDSERNAFRSGLIGARGYGRLSLMDHAAVTYGAGLAVLGSGALTAQMHGGMLVAYTNDNAVPVAQLSFALAVPIIEGRAFYDDHPLVARRPLPGVAPEVPHRRANALFPPPENQARVPRTELFVATDVGVIIPTGDTNRLSLDFGFAWATRAKDLVVSLNAADAYDSRTP
jgi:hypothetical protein